MLFKFLGNSDAPDWLMSELNTLSYVSSIRIKFILVQILNLLMNNEVDFDVIYHHLTDAKLNEKETRSVLAVLAFIVESAGRYDVEPENLQQELVQLGAPLSHSSTITRFYRDNRRVLRKYLRNNFERISVSDVFEYRSDITIHNGEYQGYPQGKVFIRFNPKNDIPFSIAMTSSQADDLIRELKTAVEIMHASSK